MRENTRYVSDDEEGSSMLLMVLKLEYGCKHIIHVT
jgi:hypothetical protein